MDLNDQKYDNFIKVCQTLEQWTLDHELFVNVCSDSFQLAKFFLEDPRLPNHANVNFDNGRCLYGAKSQKMLEYLILTMGLKLNTKIAEDIGKENVNFPRETRRLFKLAEYFQLQKEIEFKDNKYCEKPVKI